MIKLLVVDDEASICDVVKKTFAFIGFTVFTATSGRKALEIVEKQKPKIVFLDEVLADMSGLDVLEQMKQRDKDIIVIMLTVKNGQETREAARLKGADEFIEKPFSRNYLRDVVIKKIQVVLNQRGQMKKARILIVDDEDEMRSTIVDFISARFECEIEQAGDGETAIRVMAEFQPDLILIDIKMPGMGGIDTIEQIKKILPNSKVVVISAWRSAEVVNQAIHKGALDYLEKPLSLIVLQDKLKMILTSMGKMILK